MKTRRKIIVYIATSADGYIARPDGDVEWLNRRPRTVDYGIREFHPTVDTILWERKTYEWGRFGSKLTAVERLSFVHFVAFVVAYGNKGQAWSM